MYRFLAQRILSTIPVLFGIILVTFLLTRSIPGDPCRAILGERATDEVCDAFIERYGLNEPVFNQFAIYLGDILRGDLGNSFQRGRPVTELLIERMPITIELTLAAITFAALLGVPLGMISAYRRNSAVDVATMVGANFGVSMPVFWLGLMLAYLFAVILKDTPLSLPPSGRLPAGFNADPFYVAWGIAEPSTASGFQVFISRFNIINGLLTWNWQLIGESLRHLILPAVTVGTIPLAIIARMTRSSMLEALNQDYVRTARAKGLHERAVVFGHALKNALLPVVTVIGLNFGFLIAGAVLTETIFSLTGIGRTLNDAITARDYSVVQGVTLVTSIAFVFVNLFVDTLYGFLDPRIRLS
jgi:peptide/nickel transport system permease protein